MGTRIQRPPLRQPCKNLRASGTVLTGFPSEDPLFAPGTGGFDDLGYHKPTEANDGFLRHELLFRSGAILAFESTDIALSSGPVRLRHPNQRPPFLFAETPFPASSPTTTVMETASSPEWSATVK